MWYCQFTQCYLFINEFDSRFLSISDPFYCDVKFSRRERNLSGVQSVDCELSRRGWTFYTNLPSVSFSPGPVLCEILYFPNIPHFCLQLVAILSGKRSENPYSYNLLPTNNSFAWINIHQQYLTLMSALRKVQIQEITKVPLWLLPTPTYYCEPQLSMFISSWWLGSY